MRDAPKERVRGAAWRAMPDHEIPDPPEDVAKNSAGGCRPQHEVPEVFVECEKIPRRQQKADVAHLPIRHSRLQNDGGNPDPLVAKMPTAQREVVPKAARDWKRDPRRPLRRKLGNYHERQFRKEFPHVLKRGGNQVLRPRSEEDLDLIAQINA